MMIDDVPEQSASLHGGRRRGELAAYLLGTALWLSPAPQAHAAIEFQEEYAKLIKAADTMQPLSGSLFGESVSLYDGGVEFSATDVSLPGNDALPVAFGRRFVVESRGEGVRRFAMSDWDMEVPYLSAVYAQGQGWVVDIGGRTSQRRCSGPESALQAAPPNFVGGVPATEWPVEDFWIAPSLHVPGHGIQTLLFAGNGVTKPTDGRDYRWSTKNNWFLSCLTLPGSDSGSREGSEGFLVRSPDGISYRFDQMVTLPYASLIHTTGVTASHIAPREEVRLYPTRVEDRFGNSVTYTWSGNRLVRIEGSDGRVLTMTYNPAGRIATVSDQSRTWTYQYAEGAADPLKTVILPDGSRWELDMAAVANTAIAYQPAVGNQPPPMEGPYCNKSRLFVAGSPFNKPIATLRHPSGAKGTFEFAATRHGRGYVPDDCITPIDSQPLYHYNRLPIRFDTIALVGKTVSGAGIQTGAHANPAGLPGYYWSYDYQHGVQSVAAGTASHCAAQPASCPLQKAVAVIAPDGSRSVTWFGIRYGENEGYALGSAVYPVGSTTAVRQQRLYYAVGGTPTTAFPMSMGELPWRSRGDAFSSAQPHPQRYRSTQQDGESFTWEVLAFDGLAQPTGIVRGSSVSNVYNEERLAYHHDLRDWVIGQVRSVHHVNADGSLKSKKENTFSDKAQLLTESSWGTLIKRNTYYPNGLPATVSDAVGTAHATALANYHRGIPRQVIYADGSSESATIDNIGHLTSVTDEQGYTTYYDYNAAGQLLQIRPPVSDVVAWAPTTYVTQPVAQDEFGLAGSHWRQSVTMGGAVTVRYLDALLRPVLTREWDSARPSDVRHTVKRYDAESQVVFQSQPLASLPSDGFVGVRTGTHSTFDVLGRPTSTAIDSELGAAPLATVTEYLSGFQRKVTDARGNVSTSTFMAWDEPVYEYPLTILAEEGVRTEIARDIWGNPTAVTRSGSHLGSPMSATRRYVYDDTMRLCKVLEPEYGGSYLDYDVAGNLSWTAPAAYTTSSVCDRAAVAAQAKTTRGYDERNRLRSTVPPAGTASITQTYYPDGALKSMTSGNAVWTYEYNRKRLLEKETLVIDTRNFVLDWSYDTNGSARALTYPDGTVVDYAPDAWGRPTQVGGYASGVRYHANGAIAEFVYGNGIRHVMAQNLRLLPERTLDTLAGAAVVDLRYQYDRNGNVRQIVDGVGGVDSRTLSYDRLDRLTGALAPGLWGNASFVYDPLDHLRRMQVGPRVLDYQIDATKNRVDQVRDGNGAPVFNVNYDARGNVAAKGIQNFTFDQADRLLSASAAPGERGTEVYAYDGHGRRVSVQKVRESGTRYTVYSQSGQLLHELDGQNMPTNYVYLGDTLLTRLQPGSGAPATPLVSAAPNASSSATVTLNWSGVIAQGNYAIRTIRETDPAVLTNVATPATSLLLGAPEGGTYTFEVTACNQAGVCGEPGRLSNYGVTPKGVTAVNVPTVPQTGSYGISWNASIGASSYRVEESSDNGATWNLLESATTALSVTRPGTTSGRYRYQVTARNQWGARAGVLSNEVVVQTGGECVGVTSLPTPVLAMIVRTSPSGYALEWSASTCATHYKLQESTDNLTWLTPPEYPEPFGALNASFQNRGNATYRYRVQASRPQVGAPPPSAWSNIQSIVVDHSTEPPGIPQGMRLGSDATAPNPLVPDIAVYGNNQSVDALWDGVAGVSYYRLHRSAHQAACNGSDGIEVIAATPPSQFVPTWRNDIPVRRVCNGTPFTPATYSFRVQACNAANQCSGLSAPASVDVFPAGGGGNATNAIAALQPVYYHNDLLGSPVAESDSFGMIVKNSRYEPYGAPANGSYGNGPAFAGHLTDASTRLSYMQQRYYDPELGRFLSVDAVPADPNTGGMFNRYVYAANNPYKFYDPDGRCTGSRIENSDGTCASSGENTTMSSASDMNDPEPLVGIVLQVRVTGPIDTGFYPPDLQVVSDYISGVGDVLSLGITRLIRDTSGVGTTNYDSGSYTAGQVTGVVYSTAMGGGGIGSGLSGGARSIFYRGGKEGAARAATYGITLGKTPVGSFLNALDRHVRVPQFVWKGASMIFAFNARGTAIKVGLQEGGTWRLERMVLQWRGTAIKIEP